jgi:hypothetical protein
MQALRLATARRNDEGGLRLRVSAGLRPASPAQRTIFSCRPHHSGSWAALVSSAFSEAADLDDLAATVTDKAIAGAGPEHLSATGGAYRVQECR